MRVLGHIPHSKFQITAYSLNEKFFYVEIEAGPMKQCFKLHKERVVNLEGIKKWLDEEFLQTAHSHFESMYLSYDSSMKRNF